MSSKAERQRLQRILDHEEYGPKLVRLSARDQRTVLDLISENRGREARKAIVDLDEARRARARTARATRKAKPTNPLRPLLDVIADAMEAAHGDAFDRALWIRTRGSALTEADLLDFDGSDLAGWYSRSAPGRPRGYH